MSPNKRRRSRRANVRQSAGVVGDAPTATAATTFLEDPSFEALRAAMAAEQAWGEQFGKILMRRVTQATGWDEPREESGRAAWLALEELQKRLEGHACSTAQEMPSAQPDLGGYAILWAACA